MRLSAVRLLLVLFTINIAGCITQKREPVSSHAEDVSSPTKLKIIQISVSGKPFSAMPGLENTLTGPKLRKRDTVVVVVEALDTEVRPVNYSFFCPQLDVKQESANPRFEFAVTDTLLKRGFVDVEVRVNSAPPSSSGRLPFVLHFDIAKP